MGCGRRGHTYTVTPEAGHHHNSPGPYRWAINHPYRAGRPGGDPHQRASSGAMRGRGQSPWWGGACSILGSSQASISFNLWSLTSGGGDAGDQSREGPGRVPGREAETGRGKGRKGPAASAEHGL